MFVCFDLNYTLYFCRKYNYMFLNTLSPRFKSFCSSLKSLDTGLRLNLKPNLWINWRQLVSHDRQLPVFRPNLGWFYWRTSLNVESYSNQIPRIHQFKVPTMKIHQIYNINLSPNLMNLSRISNLPKPVSIERRLKSWNIEYNFKWN